MSLLGYYTPIVTAGEFLTDSLNPPTGLRPVSLLPPPRNLGFLHLAHEFRPVVGDSDLREGCYQGLQGCRELGEGVCLDVVRKPRLACPTPKLISFPSPHVCPQGEGRAPN